MGAQRGAGTQRSTIDAGSKRPTRELFSSHGIRCTRQRLAVYETLAMCRCHPTAEELFRLVVPRTGRLSLATVYNTLEALSLAGLVRRLPTTSGCCRYDADTSEHLHVRYRDTGEIEDVPAELSRQLVAHLPREILDTIGDELGVSIDGVSIQLLASR